MKKLTSILTLFHTANFLAEANSTGKEIDFIKEGSLFQLLPEPSLTERLESLGGYVVQTGHYTRLLLPFDFGITPPAQNVGKLPAQLLFYITASDAAPVKASGLNLSKQLLFVKPTAPAADYTYNKRTVSCKPCGAAAVLAAGDLVPYIPADVSLDGIQTLIQKPLGTATQPLDLKVTIDATVIPVVKDEDLKAVHHALHEVRFHTAAISFNRQSDNSALKSFAKVLVTPGQLPPGTIGLVSVPTAGLTVNDTNPLKYADLNNYIVHFPSFQATVSLTVNTPQFDGAAKLQLDGVDVPGVVAIDHPQMPNYKKVTGTVNNYKIFLHKLNQVTIVNSAKKQHMPVNPLNTYNPVTNTANITINK